MKKLIGILSFTLLYFIYIVNSFSQTSIPAGNVSGTWTLDGSPYLIQGTIQIPNDSTLTIQPGVTVNFQGHYKFFVQGRLLAIGTITDTITFTAANTTTGWWGIRFDNTPSTNDTSRINYCKIQYGISSGTGSDNYGGGLFINNFSKVLITNNYISNCTANGWGGGIFSKGNNVISNNTISNNIAISGNGGGVYSESSILSNNIISTNNAISGNGGGVFSMSSTILDNIISNNTSNSMGGGIYNASSNLSNNTVCNNTANTGGGIYSNGSGVISNNSIYNNTVSGSGGGGIYITSGSIGNLTISNNIISNNTASNVNGGGGGIFISIGSILTISNNTISNNTSNSRGGGIYFSGGNPNLTNNTVANNNAVIGGSLCCANNSDPTFRNTILWGNTASTSGSQVFLFDEASDPNFYFCNIEGGVAAFDLNFNIYTGVYSNNINSDPLFVSPSGGAGTGFDGLAADWSLQNNSPCINTGDPNNSAGFYPETDKVGNPRIVDCIIDMGAYENQNGSPFLITVTKTNVICYGANTGTATASVNPGSPPFTYLWSNGQTDSTAVNLTAGTYYVTITDNNNCSRISSVTITQPSSSMSISITKTNASCTAVCDASVTATVTNGTSPFTYSWLPSGCTTSSCTDICSGLNYVTVTDANGCTKTSSTTVNTNPAMSVSFSKTNVSCYGYSNGNATANVTNGTQPYSYLWSNGQSNQIITGLVANTYIVTITDALGCTETDSVIITQPQNPLSLSYSFSNASCNNDDGYIAVLPAGGTTPYYYYWNTGDTNYSISFLPGGTYYVTVTDFNSCTVTGNVVIDNSLPLSSLPLCVVTVDSTSTRNHVIWEKPVVANIDYFKIYREINSVFVNIADVPYSLPGFFIDTTNGINPNTTSYKYKISIVDTCGNESALSNYHRSIHVAISLALPCGYNLLWNDYEGFPVTQYLIYRDSANTGLLKIDSVSFGNTSWSDLTCYTNDTVSYRIEAVHPTGCNPFKDAVQSTNSTRSNVQRNTTITGSLLLSDITDVSVFPNPSDGKFIIVINNYDKLSRDLKLDVLNILGEVIYQSAFNSKEYVIDISGSESGMYVLRIKSNGKIYYQKLIKK